MGKYSKALLDIYSIFNQPAWKALNIETNPRGVISSASQNEFIRISIVPSDKGLNKMSVSGVLIIDIFIAAGRGQQRQFFIADSLENFLSGKSIATDSETRTQFFDSAMSNFKPDSANSSLMRASYTIPFKHFGVF
jgi:hypothetical protein